ncbi:MAG: twin-arginine translocase subunit TatC [Candidatus Omnitrophica bacterium]|nr:twin-arginine translocase subunit TatC [Candidatus Omnitrophota bacterium]
MNELYPPESQRLDFIGHLDELRRRIMIVLGCFLIMVVFLFSQGYALMALLEAPARGFIKDFIFIDPTEAFAAYFKVVLLAALTAVFPVVLYELWAFLAPALARSTRKVILGWLCLALVCFYGGGAFAYAVLLPAAINFLLGFGVGIARPEITISAYISFASIVLLAGGCVFQIPVVLAILTEAGLLDSHKLAVSRKYAILVLVVVAAIISPTQDFFNLALFSAPMIALYEIGIFLSWLVGRRKNKNRGTG